MKEYIQRVQRVDGKNKYDRAAFQQHVDSQTDGCYEMVWRKAKKPKSKNQLGAHFGLMIASAIEQANDMGMDTSSFLREMVKDDLPTGVGLTANFLKEIFYFLCPMYDEDGKRVTLSRANTVQASKHLKDCCNLLASRGIYIPEPDPEWRNK